MASRIEKRRNAYKYILEKLKVLNWNIQREMDRSIDDVNFLSLTDIEGLRKGDLDPSEELVSGLK